MPAGCTLLHSLPYRPVPCCPLISRIYLRWNYDASPRRLAVSPSKTGRDIVSYRLRHRLVSRPVSDGERSTEPFPTFSKPLLHAPEPCQDRVPSVPPAPSVTNLLHLLLAASSWYDTQQPFVASVATVPSCEQIAINELFRS